MTGRAIRDLRKGRVNLRIVLVMRVQAFVGAFTGVHWGRTRFQSAC